MSRVDDAHDPVPTTFLGLAWPALLVAAVLASGSAIVYRTAVSVPRERAEHARLCATVGAAPRLDTHDLCVAPDGTLKVAPAAP